MRQFSWPLGPPFCRFLRAGDGGSALEFALLAPVLCALLLGIVQIGLFLGLAHSLEQISADTGRYAVVGLEAGERRMLADHWVKVEAAGYPLVRQEKIAAATREADGALTVTIAYDASDLPQIPFFGALIGLPRMIQRSATLQIP